MDCLQGFAETVQWLYANGFFALVQLVVVLAGLAFTVYQVRQAAKGFQTTVVGQLATQSSALQWEILKDPDLQPILIKGDPDPEKRRRVAMGIAINHFATIYDLHLLGGVPQGVWQAFDHDLRGTLSRPGFSARWAELKQGHSAEFVAYVDSFLAPTTTT